MLLKNIYIPRNKQEGKINTLSKKNQKEARFLDEHDEPKENEKTEQMNEEKNIKELEAHIEKEKEPKEPEAQNENEDLKEKE